MSVDSEDLGAILGGASAFHKEPEVRAEPVKAEPVKTEVEAQVVQPRDDAGKFAKQDVEAKVEAKTDVKTEVKVDPEQKPVTRADVAAIIDERRKRQELERQLQQAQQTPPPSVFEDEDGAIRARVEAQTSHLKAALLNQSVRIAQMVHKDGWKDAEAGFYEAVEANPQLVHQFREAQDPGEFIYQTGIYHREMAKYGGDVVAMRDAIRAEGATALEAANARIKALEAELAEKQAAAAEAAAIPKSLNGKPSATVTAATLTDPEDVSEIVRFGK